MSKTASAMLILSIATTPAFAQQGMSGNTMPARQPLLNPLAPDIQPPNMLSEDRTCLVRNATGKKECRSKYEWRRIARQIDKQSDRSAKTLD